MHAGIADFALVKLRAEIRVAGKFTFSIIEEGESISFPQTFQATKGVWIGAKIGLYSIKQIVNVPAGYVDFDYFRFIGK